MFTFLNSQSLKQVDRRFVFDYGRLVLRTMLGGREILNNDTVIHKYTQRIVFIEYSCYETTKCISLNRIHTGGYPDGTQIVYYKEVRPNFRFSI